MAAETDIRYVCLSDLHLGAELSLLTSLMPGTSPGSPQVDPKQASPVMGDLMNCLRYLIKDQSPKPTLILLGDILELALANDSDAAMVFERFLELAMTEGGELLFEKVFYIPGNHDHHLWESARETQYVSNYLPTTKPETKLDIPWHTTKIFMELEENQNQVPSFFLNALLDRYDDVVRYDHLKSLKINTAYPNLGLIKDNRCIVFHHGHFVESIYQLMTTLKNLIFPAQKALIRTVDDLEAENFAWIDFFWSTLGRSGDWGKDVEIIYDKMQDATQFRTLIENLANGLAAKYGIPGMDISGWLGNKITKAIVDAMVDKLVFPERAQAGETDKPLSQDAETGLQNYVNGPLKIQIDEECETRHLYLPQEITFVFGHTHKPFEEPRTFPKLGNGVPVYNTGGWVVETKETSPLHGGAVLLLNEKLDVACTCIMRPSTQMTTR
ncbi:MAG: metallophosphoesterase [Desulfobaccales bacterium]|jgi:predicted phosphodiesterase